MSAKKHRTNPNPDTICSVKGYPRKLTLYKCDASPYWYVRYYDKKIIRRSTRTTNKREAEAFAKRFYEEILLRQSNPYQSWINPHLSAVRPLCWTLRKVN